MKLVLILFFLGFVAAHDRGPYSRELQNSADELAISDTADELSVSDELREMLFERTPEVEEKLAFFSVVKAVTTIFPRRRRNTQPRDGVVSCSDCLSKRRETQGNDVYCPKACYDTLLNLYSTIPLSISYDCCAVKKQYNVVPLGSQMTWGTLNDESIRRLWVNNQCDDSYCFEFTRVGNGKCLMKNERSYSLKTSPTRRPAFYAVDTRENRWHPIYEDCKGKCLDLKEGCTGFTYFTTHSRCFIWTEGPITKAEGGDSNYSCMKKVPM